MTKREFILQAMLHLAGSGQYKDHYHNLKGLVRKEQEIFDDAVALANYAEAHLWKGDVSKPQSIFEEDK